MQVTDPVCGIELDENLAILHQYEDKITISVVMGVERSLLRNLKNGKRKLNREFSTHLTELCIFY